MIRFLSRLAAPLTVAAFMAAVPAVQAGALFTDSFDPAPSESLLNFSGFANWSVSGGTVDLIRSGEYSIDCVGSTGGCVDLDGSTNMAGVMSSTATYNLTAGLTYFFSLDLSGNQVRLEDNTVKFGFAAFDELDFFFAAREVVLGETNPFTTYTLAFTPVRNVSARLVIRNEGGDNVGLILDNAQLEVPEPGTLALLGLGLAALGLRRRRAA